MQVHHSSRIVALVAVILMTSGCKLDFLGGATGSKRLSKNEIKREIAKAKKQLPVAAEEGLILTDINLEYSGGITVWVQCDDELTRQMRAIGSHTIKESAKDHLSKIDPDSANFPKELQQLLNQDVPIQYIFEDKFGSHLASVTLSEEAFAGKERLGEEQNNPFAVNTVSRNRNKKESD
ncbi:MAG: hypothetical protein AAFX06_16005 [Planctomycetota bacterium]